MSQIFIFSALECEAKPLIQHFCLKKQSNSYAYDIYKNEHIVLTVTGVGKNAMAASVAYTLALYKSSIFPVLINLGIAGHKTLAIGTLLLASKIADQDTGKNFYPQLIGNKWPETSEIYTSSRPATDYNLDSLCDMEASAFYETAIRFSSSELIHCIKIVSDNQNSSVDNIKPKTVTAWITNQLKLIEQVMQQLSALSLSIPTVELNQYSHLEEKWHFSSSGKVKLKNLLLRWEALSSEYWNCNEEHQFKNSKDVLRKLEADVARLKVNL